MLRSRLLSGAAFLFLLAGWSSPAAADQRADQIVRALGPAAQVVDVVSTSEWTWTQVELADEVYPLRIDILTTNGCDDDDDGQALIMLPGSGLNFDSNFFTPRDRNIALFMLERGYTVIGINSRADSLLPTSNDAFIAAWGLDKLRSDTHAVIQSLRPVIGPHFDILGHSLGAIEALDYAANYPEEPKQIFIIDANGPFDPVAEPNLVHKAEATSAAYQTLLDQGLSVFDVFGSAKQLIAAAAAYPTADSGVPRTPFPGDFTLLGLVYFSLIHSGDLPGITTPYTGLPQNWWAQSGCAGTYAFATDPLLDAFSLTQTPFSVLTQVTAGSGVVPTAQFRDIHAFWAGDGGYAIPLEDIRAKVHWVNTGLGFGSHPYGSQLIQAGGNRHVRYSVVPGYAHLDPVYGANAWRDFWPVLVGD
jgi:pimeloyl-ACP methyl ester carboxylesterase